MQLKTTVTTVTGALLAFAAIAAPNAMGCSVPGISTYRQVAAAPQLFGPLANISGKSSSAALAPGQANSIVGLWYIQFISDGFVVDQAFDVWHSDGTEVLNDFTDPIEDNVCLGAWSQSGSTYTLKHPSWTFDTTGTLTGLAIISESVTMENGNTFGGTYVIKLFDTMGNPVGTYEGVVKAIRITAD